MDQKEKEDDDDPLTPKFLSQASNTEPDENRVNTVMKEMKWAAKAEQKRVEQQWKVYPYPPI